MTGEIELGEFYSLYELESVLDVPVGAEFKNHHGMVYRWTGDHLTYLRTERKEPPVLHFECVALP